jgi:hypothetical protein
MKMTVTYVPVPSEAIGESPKTYELNPGDPLPSIGDAITFEDWTKPYRVVSRSFHYVDQDTLQVFFGFERDKSAK